MSKLGDNFNKYISMPPKEGTRSQSLPENRKEAIEQNINNASKITENEYKVITNIAKNINRFEAFLERVKDSLEAQKEAGESKLQTGFQQVQQDGSRIVAECECALQKLASIKFDHTKYIEYRPGPFKIPEREKVIQKLLQHEISVLSTMAKSSLDNFQKEIEEHYPLPTDLRTKKQDQGHLRYAPRFEIASLPDLLSVRKVLTSAFQSVPEVAYSDLPSDLRDVSKSIYWKLQSSSEEPYSYKRVVEKLSIRGLYTIKNLEIIRNRLDKASRRAEDPETAKTLHRWKEHLTETIYDEKLYENKQKYAKAGELYSMAVIYDDTNPEGIPTEVSFPGSVHNKLHEDLRCEDLENSEQLKMIEQLRRTKKDSEVGVLGEVHKILEDKLSTLEENKTKVKTLAIDVLQRAGPCEACDYRFKRFVKEWTKKLVEPGYVGKFTLKVHFNTAPIIRYYEGQKWQESVETGKEYEVRYGQDPLAIKTQRSRTMYVQIYAFSDDKVERLDQKWYNTINQENTANNGKVNKQLINPETVNKEFKEVASEFINKKGNLTDETKKKIIDNRGLHPEEADHLIKLIIDDHLLPQNLDDAEYDKRVKCTKAYFRKLTRIGDTGLLYRDIVNEFPKQKGKLTDETKKKIIDNRGLHPEEADHLIKLITDSIPQDDKHGQRAEETKAYFRELTRIGDTGLWYGKVADEFLQHSAELPQETKDVFYKQRLLSEDADLIVMILLHKLESLLPEECTQIKSEIDDRTNNDNIARYIRAYFRRFIRQKDQKETLYEQYASSFVENTDKFMKHMQEITNKIGKFPKEEINQIENVLVERVTKLDDEQKKKLKKPLEEFLEKRSEKPKRKTINRLIKLCLRHFNKGITEYETASEMYETANEN